MPAPTTVARRIRRVVRPSISHLILVGLIVIWIYPFAWTISAAFKSQSEMLIGGVNLIPSEPTLDNFARAWTIANFSTYTVNTVIYSAAAVAVIVLVSATAGYALGRGPLPGKVVVVGALIATMFIPHGYGIIPVFELVSALGLNNTIAGVVLATAGPAHVVPILLFMGYFSTLPGELEEAARIDGAGYFRIFWTIMLPLAKPVIGTVTLTNFIAAWNAFFLPLVFTLGNPQLRTLGVGMYNFRGEFGNDWTGIAAAACISLLPIIIVFLFLQRYIVDGIAGAIKS